MPIKQRIKVGSIESVQGDPDILKLHELSAQKAQIELDILELKLKLLRRHKVGNVCEAVTIYSVRPTRVRSYERAGYTAVRVNR